MDALYPFLALLILGAAAAAVSLRKLVHSALCLVAVFVGVAVAYLLLGAEFLSFAQILVYVGAIAILIVFVILLTRNTDGGSEPLVFRPAVLGVGVAVLTAGAILACVGSSQLLPAARESAPALPVRELGRRLMTDYVVPLQIIGLLLTAALIGAVVLAQRDPPGEPEPPPDPPS